ncbi:MAG: 1,4-alpha-glucan branching protein GlgB, partial [Sphingobacteriaceae bacterium]|nr:1,4-alpha-glucan branching protein GlgB [Cytophagaceae bacterium]
MAKAKSTPLQADPKPVAAVKKTTTRKKAAPETPPALVADGVVPETPVAPAPVEAAPVATAAPRHLNAVEPYSRFSEFDIHLFRAGKHHRLYEKMGSHVVEHLGVTGTYFAVWAPNAKYISVIGNFNGWDRGSHPLFVRYDSSGIWEGFIPHVGNGETYKYFIHSNQGQDLEKGDPYALRWETPPSTASIVWDTWYEWKDGDWMATRGAKNALNAPTSVYEIHLGSWLRDPADPTRILTVGAYADRLVQHI